MTGPLHIPQLINSVFEYFVWFCVWLVVVRIIAKFLLPNWLIRK